MNLENTTVLVVSHDRHFLIRFVLISQILTMVKLKMYVGNYDFWYESNELMKTLINNKNKKLEQKDKSYKNLLLDLVPMLLSLNKQLQERNN